MKILLEGNIQKTCSVICFCRSPFKCVKVRNQDIHALQLKTILRLRWGVYVYVQICTIIGGLFNLWELQYLFGIIVLRYLWISDECFFFILYKGFILLRIFLGELVDLVVEGLGKLGVLRLLFVILALCFRKYIPSNIRFKHRHTGSSCKHFVIILTTLQ